MSMLSRLLGQVGLRPARDAVDAATDTSTAQVVETPLPDFPDSAEALRSHKLLNEWWYYGVELLHGVQTGGTYPRELPMLPRMMLRNCSLSGAECLDLGSMEGLMSALMCRGGAARVVATDAYDHCREKMAAVKHYYEVDFDFRQVGLMYDLYKKMPGESFDLINCSGLLYHVVSPMQVLMGCRPLLKRNGLMIVSTNVVISDRCLMEFNDGGRLQEEANTFWYLSVKYFEYLLRFLKLRPIDSMYLPHQSISNHVRYRTDVPSGYLSVVCRAVDHALPAQDDTWMQPALDGSWEMQGLTDWQRTNTQELSKIGYKCADAERDGSENREGIDLQEAVLGAPEVVPTPEASDTHYLWLSDQN